MRYWGILLLKLMGIGAFVEGAWRLMQIVLPPPATFLYHQFRPFGRDLTWTVAILLLFLVTTGLLYVAVRDQVLRCRKCGRRLRMPVLRGSYSKMLQEGRPKFEYICPYGHGTLSVPGTRFQGRDPNVWQSNKDLWESLVSADRSQS
jgi:hypothetical protein